MGRRKRAERERPRALLQKQIEIPISVDASMIGTRRSYQLWFQDPGDPFGVGLSDAVTFFFCP